MGQYQVHRRDLLHNHLLVERHHLRVPEHVPDCLVVETPY